MRSTKTVSLLLAAALAACAGNKDNIDITKPVTGEAATNAQRAYTRGLEERKNQNFMEATRFFEWVRNNFPYSQFAALSELLARYCASLRETQAASPSSPSSRLPWPAAARRTGSSSRSSRAAAPKRA